MTGATAGRTGRTKPVPVPPGGPPAALDHRAPHLGGFSLSVLRIEIRRLLRNRRTITFALIAPVIFFLVFGLNKGYMEQSAGQGNVSAVVMISMALYGAVLATASGGAMVSIERASGWSRQLRVTPLTPLAYIAIKMLTSLVLGAASVLAVYFVGALTGKPSMPLRLWALTALFVWVGSLLFAAFGLFLGYLLPSENVMQVIGFTLMLCSFGGGLFVPLTSFSPTLITMAKFTPLYGLSQLVHYPLVGGGLQWTWFLNLGAWLVIFVTGAGWRFHHDTARV